MEVNEALKVDAKIPTGVPTFLICNKPSVCMKAFLEQTVLLYPLKHYLDNIALQEVVYCYHSAIINKGTQTDHYNPKKWRSFL